MADRSLHPIEEVPGISENVDFVKASFLTAAGQYWDRCQDLPREVFATATRDHYVLAVSHGWCYQTHPDPDGTQAKLVNSLIEDLLKRGASQSIEQTLVFLDFVSTPQHAFAVGQATRSKEQSDRFARALKLFPQIYLMADATLHINGGVDGSEEMEYVTTVEELKRAKKLEQMGDSIQVMEWGDSDCAVVPFDSVVSIGGVKINTMADLNKALNPEPKAKPEPPKSAWESLVPGWMTAGQCCTSSTDGDDNLVIMRRCPYGMPNNSPVALRGWVYLERFVSMVKSAMVPESQMTSVAFSDDPRTLDEIFAGGRKLRQAAAQGTERLKVVLEEFVDVLNEKRFKSTSVDKLKNVGGVGGVTGGSANAPPSDKDVVRILMEELTEFLAKHWEAQTKVQQQRQLILAITRNNVKDVQDILQAGADPNCADPQGITSLHLAAALHRHEAAKYLLEHKGDLRIQDKLGNIPAHKVALLSVDATVHTFALMAPSRNELVVRNEAGITPFMRFEVWVQTELVKTPFLPAKAHLQHLHKTMPDIDSASTDVMEGGALLSPIRSDMQTYTTKEGRKFQVRVWEPFDKGNIDLVEIVCLSLEFLLPSRLAEPAWHAVARSVCQKWMARLWVLDYNVVSDEAMEAPSFERTHRDCAAAIEALPIEGKFVLVDSSLGETTPLVWAMKDRILAFLIVNFRGFHADDFCNGDMCGKICKRFGAIGAMCKKQDYEGMSKLLGDYAYSDGEKKMQSNAAHFMKCAAREPSRFFEHAAFHCRRIEQDIMERTKFYKASSTVDLPGIIACGSFSPAMWTLEAAPRLRELLPESTIQYIHMGKSCWAMEGVQQSLQLSKLMGMCLKKVFVGRNALVARSQRAAETWLDAHGADDLHEDEDGSNQAEVDATRLLTAKNYFRDSVKELASSDVWMTVPDLRFIWDKVLLIDTRPKECRQVSAIPGALGPEDITDKFLAKPEVAAKTLVLYDDIGTLSAHYLQGMRGSGSRSGDRWTSARIMELGLIGWCHDGGMLETAVGAPTLSICTTLPVASKAFPMFYDVHSVAGTGKMLPAVMTKLVRAVTAGRKDKSATL